MFKSKILLLLFCIIISCNNDNEKNSQIQWDTSDKKDLAWGLEYNGTHQFIANSSFKIVEQAHILLPSVASVFYYELLKRLKNYKQSLILSSDLPDDVESDAILGIPTFSGHFYNPDNGKNYKGQKNPTAYTRTLEHSENAVKYLKMSLFVDKEKYKLKYIELAAVEIGMSIHYISDACEFHHATNQIAYLSSHVWYEHYVNEKIKNNPKNFILTSPSVNYSNIFGDFVHNCAIYSKKFSKIITKTAYCFGVNCSNYANWEYVAYQTIKEAQNQSAGYLASILMYSAISMQNNTK